MGTGITKTEKEHTKATLRELADRAWEAAKLAQERGDVESARVLKEAATELHARAAME